MIILTGQQCLAFPEAVGVISCPMYSGPEVKMKQLEYPALTGKTPAHKIFTATPRVFFLFHIVSAHYTALTKSFFISQC